MRIASINLRKSPFVRAVHSSCQEVGADNRGVTSSLIASHPPQALDGGSRPSASMSLVPQQTFFKHEDGEIVWSHQCLVHDESLDSSLRFGHSPDRASFLASDFSPFKALHSSQNLMLPGVETKIEVTPDQPPHLEALIIGNSGPNRGIMSFSNPALIAPTDKRLVRKQSIFLLEVGP